MLLQVLVTEYVQLDSYTADMYWQSRSKQTFLVSICTLITVTFNTCQTRMQCRPEVDNA